MRCLWLPPLVVLVKSIAQSVQAADSHVVSLVANTDTAITIAAAVGTYGWSWFQNLDATNYVQWGPTVAGAIAIIGRMNPGEPAGPFRLEPGIVLRMQAHTGACKVQVFVLAD